MAVTAIQVVANLGATQNAIHDFGAATPLADGERIKVTTAPDGGNWILLFTNEPALEYSDLVGGGQSAVCYFFIEDVIYTEVEFWIPVGVYRYLLFVSNDPLSIPVGAVHIERSNTPGPIGLSLMVPA